MRRCGFLGIDDRAEFYRGRINVRRNHRRQGRNFLWQSTKEAKDVVTLYMLDHIAQAELRMNIKNSNAKARIRMCSQVITPSPTATASHGFSRIIRRWQSHMFCLQFNSHRSKIDWNRILDYLIMRYETISALLLLMLSIWRKHSNLSTQDHHQSAIVAKKESDQPKK